jgi:tungstate transport system ATP-binding protein
MSLFSLADVTRGYDRRTVLDIPKLDIEENRIHALLGPNGAGKTTLLNILGFLEPPTTGEIHFRSKPVRFIEAELQQLRRSIEETLDLVGMRSFIHYPAHQLSGGETQRVALARALALSPEVLLCDEPTSSVDVENQNLIMTLLRRINEVKKISVLFTTHDRSQAARLAHHTIVLNKGRLAPTMYENIFRGALKSSPSGQLRCVIQDKIELAVAEAQMLENRETVSVFIDPEKIVPQRPLENPDTANQLRGRVVQILEENGRVRIVIDAGVWIALLVSKKTYQMSKFMVGETTDLGIPPEAIHIM